MPFDYLLQAFVTLFVIVDPVALAPVFLLLTTGLDPAIRRRIALRAVIISMLVLTAFALAGRPFIALLGISLPAFRVAGGLLLFATAFEMVFERRQARKEATADTAVAADEHHDVAAFPLAIPLIAGPGAITAVMLLSDAAQGSTAKLAGLIGVIALVLAICLAVALIAGRVDRLLGRTGRIVFSRLLGVILAALAVQFAVDGLRELLG